MEGGGGGREVGWEGWTNFSLAVNWPKSTPSPAPTRLHPPPPPPTIDKKMNSAHPFPAFCAHSKCNYLLLVSSILCLKSDEYMDRAREFRTWETISCILGTLSTSVYFNFVLKISQKYGQSIKTDIGGCSRLRRAFVKNYATDFVVMYDRKWCNGLLWNLICIGVGRGGPGPPNNLRGGPTYPMAPPIIHPPFPTISMWNRKKITNVPSWRVK